MGVSASPGICNCTSNGRHTKSGRYGSLVLSVPGIEVLDDSAEIEFITDVEGNWEYFLLLVSRSKLLYWDGAERGLWGHGVLMLQPHGILVFGGDAVDKGPGDIRFVKILLSLKERYPMQVFIILGNRDINKLRFYAELAPGEDGSCFFPYWESKSKLYLDYIKEKGSPQGQMSTLHWMLDCNMGCQTTFKTRLCELALLYGQAEENDVFLSFRNSVDPTGSDPWMLDLLRVGHLAVVLGDSLFVHAGIQEGAVGVVPTRSDVFDNVWDWAAALNDWKNNEIMDFIQWPGWQKDEMEGRRRGAQQLIEYGTAAGGNKTVVYCNPFQNGNCACLPPKVEDFLNTSCIKRVLCGHQPHGQSPAVVRHLRTGLLTLHCDTSFSDTDAPKYSNLSNNRGNIATIIRLEGPYLHCEGIFKDGVEHGFTLHTDMGLCKLPDLLVGMQLTDGSWIKTMVDDKGSGNSAMVRNASNASAGSGSSSSFRWKRSRLIAVRGLGFKLRVNAMHASQVKLLLKKEYREHIGYLNTINMCHFTEDWKNSSLLENEDAPDEREAYSQHTFPPFKRKEFDTANCYIFGLDGVVCKIENSLQQQVVRNINAIIAAGKRVVFLATNASYSSTMLTTQLHDLGIRGVSTDNIICSAGSCAWLVSNMNVQRPFILCSGTAVMEEFRKEGISNYIATVQDNGEPKEEYLRPVTSDNVQDLMLKMVDVDCIVIADDYALTALKLAIVSAFIKWNEINGRRNIKIVTTSLENDHLIGRTSKEFCKTHAFQNLAVETLGVGAICSAIANVCETGQEPINAGLPGVFLAERLRRRKEDNGYEIDFDNTVMIDDQIETGVAFAHLVGMKSLLVLSGSTNREDLNWLEKKLNQSEADASQIPTWVVDSIANI